MVITNERQYELARGRLRRLLLERRRLQPDGGPAAVRAAGGPGPKGLPAPDFGAARLLDKKIEELKHELESFATLRFAASPPPQLPALAELPQLLIQARIYCGLTHQGLARELGLKEQTIQRYEAQLYGCVSLRRLVAISSVLTCGMAARQAAMAAFRSRAAAAPPPQTAPTSTLAASPGDDGSDGAGRPRVRAP